MFFSPTFEKSYDEIWSLIKNFKVLVYNYNDGDGGNTDSDYDFVYNNLYPSVDGDFFLRIHDDSNQMHFYLKMIGKAPTTVGLYKVGDIFTGATISYSFGALNDSDPTVRTLYDGETSSKNEDNLSNARMHFGKIFEGLPATEYVTIDFGSTDVATKTLNICELILQLLPKLKYKQSETAALYVKGEDGWIPVK